MLITLLCCDWLQEKRLSGLSNQSHDSQASNSTASANSHNERQGLNNQGHALLVGHRQDAEEEELDEMEVEYIEVSNPQIYILSTLRSSHDTECSSYFIT